MCWDDLCFYVLKSLQILHFQNWQDKLEAPIKYLEHKLGETTNIPFRNRNWRKQGIQKCNGLIVRFDSLIFQFIDFCLSQIIPHNNFWKFKKVPNFHLSWQFLYKIVSIRKALGDLIWFCSRFILNRMCSNGSLFNYCGFFWTQMITFSLLKIYFEYDIWIFVKLLRLLLDSITTPGSITI